MQKEPHHTLRPLPLLLVLLAVLLPTLVLAKLVVRPTVVPMADAQRGERAATANDTPFGDAPGDANANPAIGSAPTAREAAAAGVAAQSIALRILDADRMPVADAAVRIDPNAAQIGYWDLQDAEPLLAAIAPRFSDAEGLVHAHMPSGVAMVTARKGDGYVQVWVDVHESISDPIELQLLDDRRLVVHTQLADGTAAPHVPVELFYSWDRDVPPDQLHRFVLARTDEHGDLVVPHAQRLFRYTPPAPNLLLQPLVAGAAATATSVSLATTRTRVELTCAPHGAIRGTSFGRDGQPVAAPVARSLQYLNSEDAYENVAVPRWPQDAPSSWLLHPLALGTRWMIDGDPYESLEVVGPRRHGEIVDVQQRRLRTDGRLRFSVQAPDGTALALESVSIESDERPTADVLTDQSGGVDVRRFPNERLVRITARRSFAEGVLQISSDPADHSASLDAGVVRLEPQRLLLQGVVVDARSGAPLAAWLHVQSRQDPTATTRAGIESAADGSFEIWGRAAGPLLVWARRQRHRVLEQEFQAGDRDVVLRLVAEQQLFVTLLFDAEIDDEEIVAYVEPQRRNWTSYRSERGVRKQVVPLADGTKRTLVVATADHPLARIDESEWQHSARGASVTVDLRGRLATFVIDAVRQGERVPADIRLLTGTPEDRLAGSINAARAFVLTNDRPWRALVLPECGGVVEVALRPGRNVVEVPGPARVRCQPRSDDGDLGDTTIAFELLLLRRDEALLATIEVDDEDLTQPLPTTIEQLRDDRRNFTVAFRPPASNRHGEFWIGRRGRYALFAVLQEGGCSVMLQQPALQFDVATFDCDLPISMTVQPAALAAARQQLTRGEDAR